jgi:hypothetical protein
LPVAEEPELAPEPEPEPEPELAPLPPAAVEPVSATDEIPPARSRRLRSLLRRREHERDLEQEPEVHDPPRHVKLLPRKTAPESSRAEQEVAELFNESEKREEHGT